MKAVAAAVNLFPALDAAGARYVHWKSNEHLQPALAAETDLDILFDRSQYRLVRRVLDECGFKPFLTTARTGYPGIEDHFALDPDTGRLVHCHAHFLLSAGARYLKGHRIPWEERFLATAHEDPSTGVRIADPNLELLTLLIRAAMKLRTRDRLAPILGRQAFTGGTLRGIRMAARARRPGGDGLPGPRAAGSRYSPGRGAIAGSPAAGFGHPPASACRSADRGRVENPAGWISGPAGGLEP